MCRRGCLCVYLCVCVSAWATLVAAFDGYHELGGSSDRGVSSDCYDNFGNPQRCLPSFENAAYARRVEATNTCGEGPKGPVEFCVQTNKLDTVKYCQVCTKGMHSAEYLTDFTNNTQTWWQSETMLEDIQYPTQVNLTLHFKKAYDITYVRLLFKSPRPNSFAIYKRFSEDSPWVPFQYYSEACRDTYQLPDSKNPWTPPPRVGDETRALCTSEYSDISPLTGGQVPFSTLEGRPSNYKFDSSPELQEWVTATDIRITLDRLNTFGDEVFWDPQVLRSYYYAIIDFAVGARCKCNGHARECVPVRTMDGDEREVCRCEHNTAGVDCQECLPFYNDAPWGRANSTHFHECKACNCNGFSNRCYFDKERYEETGHGGHCLDCSGNRDGANCERCRDNFYQREDSCVACNCHEVGSRYLQCNGEGRCHCKPGVTGEKCDRCDANFYDFGPWGCKPCDCYAPGSYNNEPMCDSSSGVCQCKERVEGRRCTGCKPGFFNMDESNEFGCTPCFCYGHSSVCRSAPGYSKVLIESIFARNNERWRAEDSQHRPLALEYNAITQSIGVTAPSREPIYFVAPDRFLQDQRASYNQDLEFHLRIGEIGPVPTIEDIILEGAGLYVTQTIFGQSQGMPTIEGHEYKFRLHENPDYGWQPRLSARDFMSVLANLTAIKIRGTYTPQGVGFLDDVKLHTARRGAAGAPASWIEMCTCPTGYVGQFCESCAPGSRHDPPNGGPFAPCVPCNCNGHADICDADTGRCICQHNTAGENCQLCARGYYGNSLDGTPQDCKECPCPNQGACIQLEGLDVDETIVCIECPKGYSGPQCDLCSDGYFGDPKGRHGPARPCQACDCSLNVDMNAVGNCNRTTGECLKCIYNTVGPQCDQCLPGYYGDALALQKGDCKPCQCYLPGTEVDGSGPPICDQLRGQCRCKPHVTGTNCDQCQPGYYNIISGQGCQPCKCNSVGSHNQTCDTASGQCYCRPGVTGLQCDICEPYYFGFSIDGCKACDCDSIGSKQLQCDTSGQCECAENVEGRSCDRCKENKYDRHRSCVDCPPCYNLVQDAVNKHREKLERLDSVLRKVEKNPTVIDDKDFDSKLNTVLTAVEDLWRDAKDAGGINRDNMLDELEKMKKRLNEFATLIKQADDWIVQADGETKEAKINATQAEHTIDQAKDVLQSALDYLQTDGATALARAKGQSSRFGQQNQQMSEIAREARNLAEMQEEQAKEIQQIAESAVNLSTQAYDIAKDAIDHQKDISDKIRSLNPDMQRTKEKLNLTAIEAEDTVNYVNAVYNETWAILSEVYDQMMPETNAEDLKDKSISTANEAKQIRDEANGLYRSHEKLLEEIGELMIVGEEVLQGGLEKQQYADELLGEADKAKDTADKAVELGNKTLHEAEHTYQTLQGFDSEVRKSKEKAQEALNKIPEIEQSIHEAKLKTTNAQEALAGTGGYAETAKDHLTSANTIGKEAEKIKTTAELRKAEASNLRDEAEALERRVAVTESEVQAQEQKAHLEEELIGQAQEKVGEARTRVAGATELIEDALSNVNKIMQELEYPSNIDGNMLLDLADQLSKLESDLNSTKLDEQLATLHDAKIYQTKLVNDYTTEVNKLEEEVAKIKRIRDALPRDCGKPPNIET